MKPFCEFAAVKSLYISGIATNPEYRNRGIGTGLMEQMITRARNLDLPKLSLLAFEQNQGAVRLYERLGFKIVDRNPVMPHPLIHYTGDVVLMTATVS